MLVLNTHTINIERFVQGEGYWLDGKYIEGSITTIPVKCSLQPYSDGFSQKDLPDGQRLSGSYLVFTQTELIALDEILDNRPDEFELNGIRYECFKIEPWVGFSLNTSHYQCLFTRKDKG